VKVGDLFSGIGGFSLAARWMGWETLWFSEIDPYASRVLAKHWPDVPNLGDITKIDWSHVERPDLLCGGFPCQDISNAGKRAGIDGERSGLWSEFARAIRELRPRYVVVENVPALVNRGIDRVLGDLAACGYDAEWDCIPAAALGADHVRERVWIVAHAHGRGRQILRLPQPRRVRRQSRRFPDRRCVVWQFADATELGAIWQVEPGVGRVVNGVSRRVDRLGRLGNAVVPQAALQIFRAIEASEARDLRAA
jgi:DNA (cytosine-5)-methyltransferase 1